MWYHRRLIERSALKCVLRSRISIRGLFIEAVFVLVANISDSMLQYCSDWSCLFFCICFKMRFSLSLFLCGHVVSIVSQAHTEGGRTGTSWKTRDPRVQSVPRVTAAASMVGGPERPGRKGRERVSCIPTDKESLTQTRSCREAVPSYEDLNKVEHTCI